MRTPKDRRREAHLVRYRRTKARKVREATKEADDVRFREV